MNLDIKGVQSLLLKMAIEIRNILEDNNIPYFITYGTLLGAVRHEGFIPWDDDFDFYITEDYYDDAINLLRTHLPKRYFLEDELSEPLYFHGWAHVKDNLTEVDFTLYPQDGIYNNKGLSIDIYKAYLRKESQEHNFRIEQHIEYLTRKFTKGLISEDLYHEKVNQLKSELLKDQSEGNDKDVYVFPSIYNDRIYPDELFPLSKYKFEDTYFLGPKNADVFLHRCYGDYMKLPPVEKRKPHYSTVTLKD